MKICVFGGAGQLGSEFPALVDSSTELVLFDLPQVDITEQSAVRDLLGTEKPDIVINAAAYTAVDKAEGDEELAFQVNEIGASNIASASRQLASKLLSISTDYVFGGDSQRDISTLLTENDSPDPCNTYGRSKLAGELAVAREYPGSLIVRTSSVHGAHGHNFVHTMLRLMEERSELNVVNDQIMSPTWSGWLAKTLLHLATKDAVGILHASCEGAISWFEFAVAIRSLATFPDGVTPATVHPIATEQYPLPARRPVFSAMDCSRLEQLLPGERINWVDGLKGHLGALDRLREGAEVQLNEDGVVYE